MHEDSQQDAEAKLAQQLEEHQRAEAAKDQANLDSKASKKEAKQAALNAKQRHYLLTHTGFNSWYEALALLVFPALSWALFGRGHSENAGLSVAIGLGFGFFYLVYLCDTFGGIFARLSLAREQAYLKGLPFAQDGYWSLISVSPSGEETRVQAKIQFSKAATPKEEILKGMVRKFQDGFYIGSGESYSLSIDSSDNSLTLKSHPLSTPKYGKGKPVLRHSGALHEWARGFLRQVAEPLHKAYPIEQLSLSRR